MGSFCFGIIYVWRMDGWTCYIYLSIVHIPPLSRLSLPPFGLRWGARSRHVLHKVQIKLSIRHASHCSITAIGKQFGICRQEVKGFAYAAAYLWLQRQVECVRRLKAEVEAWHNIAFFADVLKWDSATQKLKIRTHTSMTDQQSKACWSILTARRWIRWRARGYSELKTLPLVVPPAVRDFSVC